MKKDADILKEFVLDWINTLRINRGHKPLIDIEPGECGNAARCPVANSIPEVESISSSSYTYKNGKNYVPPKFVGEFIKKFDNGYYPEYIDTTKRLFDSKACNKFAEDIITLIALHNKNTAVNGDADFCETCKREINHFAKEMVILTR